MYLARLFDLERGEAVARLIYALAFEIQHENVPVSSMHGDMVVAAHSAVCVRCGVSLGIVR